MASRKKLCSRRTIVMLPPLDNQEYMELPPILSKILKPKTIKKNLKIKTIQKKIQKIKIKKKIKNCKYKTDRSTPFICVRELNFYDFKNCSFFLSRTFSCKFFFTISPSFDSAFRGERIGVGQNS